MVVEARWYKTAGKISSKDQNRVSKSGANRCNTGKSKIINVTQAVVKTQSSNVQGKSKIVNPQRQKQFDTQKRQ